jgi:hypothetical protein
MGFFGGGGGGGQSKVYPTWWAATARERRDMIRSNQAMVVSSNAGPPNIQIGSPRPLTPGEKRMLRKEDAATARGDTPDTAGTTPAPTGGDTTGSSGGRKAKSGPTIFRTATGQRVRPATTPWWLK